MSYSIKKISYALLFFICCFFSVSIFAGDFIQDTSTAFLTILFGSVSSSFSDVLPGGDQKTIIGSVFYTFNGFVATIGTALVGYITVISLLNSSYSGKPMGEKWHTLFLPMRVTLGAAMLVPNAFGYNFAQILTMWFILTGVTGADNMWEVIANRLASDGDAAITSGKPPGYPDDPLDNPDNKLLIGTLEKAIRFAVCVGSYGIKPSEFIDPSKPDSAITQPTKPKCYPACNKLPVSFTNDPYGDNGKGTITPTDKAIESKCGSLTWQQLNFTDSMRVDYVNAVQNELILPIANAVRSEVFDDLFLYPNMQYDAELSDPGVTNALTSVSTTALDAILNMRARISTTVADQKTANNSNTKTGPAVTAKNIGWISAGATYYALVKAGNDAAQTGGGTEAGKFKSSYIGDMAASSVGDQKIATALMNQIKGLPINGSASTPPPTTNATLAFSRGFDNIPLRFLSLGIADLLTWIINEILGPGQLFGYPDQANVVSVDALKGAIGGGGDPLARIAEKGAKLSGIIESIFFAFMLSIVIAGAIAGFIPGMPYMIPGISLMIPIITMAMVAIVSILMLFYPVAILMNMYVPIIPFMIYTTGVLGWFLLCVEAMAAAPLVAIGLMHPSGSDEVLGSAETGLKLLINLMLRPILMIAGLVSGLVLVRLILLYFSIGMNLVFESGLIPIKSVSGVAASTYIYIFSAIVIIHKCFNLINVIPDKIMTWIGATGGQVGESTELLQEAKSQTKEGGEMGVKTAKAGYEGGQSGYQMGKGITKRPGGGGGGGGGEGEGGGVVN